ncbi:MAG TPA: hypothetical protein VM848_12205 [Acidimicrobiia bacterium]|nr:hypothetical protein [Acidimicrobiia bacterium]
MTARAVLLVFAPIIATACSASPGVEPLTSSSSTNRTETTISQPVPVTTSVPGPVDIPGRAFVLEPGLYTTNRFLVPLTFNVDVSGWRTSGAEDDWVGVSYVEEGANTIAASLIIIAYRSTDTVDAVLGAITSIEGVTVLSDPMPTVVGGRDASVLDVHGTPDPTVVGNGSNREECSYPGGSGRFFFDGPGYQLFSKEIHAFGIPACYRSRVWVVDVDSTTITMIGTTDDTSDFARLVSEIEHFLEGIQFHRGG